MTYLLLLTSEVVGGLLLASNSIVQVCISTIIGSEDSKLVSLGIVDIKTDSTVLSAISNLGAWANGCYVVGEEKGEDFFGGISGIRDGA